MKTSLSAFLYLAALFGAWGGPAAAQIFTQPCPSPHFPAVAAIAIDGQCKAAGIGKKADGIQDKAKNNFCATGPVTEISFNDLRDLQATVEQNKKINFGNPMDHPLSKKAGPTSDRKPLRALGEGGLRVVEGFIMIARREGKEGVNCGANVPDQIAFHDIHISLVRDQESIHSDECESIVVEMSPHHRPGEWTQPNLAKVSAKHARVRVTGQLFFDSSHTRCVDGARVQGDPSRFSLWEIHPVYQFEVCDGHDCSIPANWLTLEGWVKNH